MSKGGSQTTETKQELPKWVTDAAKEALARSQAAANIGYVPYSGPQVAAFSPMQNDSFAGTNMAAQAYGLPSSQGNGMPAPTTFADGTQGYSSMPLYEQALAQLKQSNPAQFAALTSMFPQPGGQSGNGGGGQGGPQDVGAAPILLNNTPARSNNSRSGNSGGNGESLMDRTLRQMAARRDFIGPTNQSNPFSGYSGPIDMINGGGPGASGNSYQGGGLLSDAANFRSNPFNIRGR